ncbi:deoxynucleotidyltransferase terminal-interacting protein 2 [Scyliorhinus canicula]|uniref:deoxynucleotidyltransferase terminal-interacting protein 2 n=1 Tax=Scyliorhinus canicula TaxID=7830 RepID=UPI0018F70F7E|nr:deoxynucleotidyltransferase terminal-interacting protein 2 [Scyliorhinus canicula]
MPRRWWPVRGNAGRKYPGEGFAVAPSGSGALRAGNMVQTRSGRQTQARKGAKSRLQTPVSQKKTRSSRVESQSESITESQPEEQQIVEEQQLILAESQPCPKQATELSDRLERNDQCSESDVVESNAETEKEKPNETETPEIESQPCPAQPVEPSDRLERNDQRSESEVVESNAETEMETPNETETQEANLIEIVEVDEGSDSDHETKVQPCEEQRIEPNDRLRRNDQYLESNIAESNTEKEKPNETETHETILIETDEGSDTDHETQSVTLTTITLQLSSDEDRGAVGAEDSEVLLEESSFDVISGPSVSPEPSAIPPATAKGSELFVIDKQPGVDHDRKYYLDLSEKEESGEEQEEDGERGEETGDQDEESDKEGDDDDFIDEDDDDDILKTKSSLIELSSSIDSGLNLKELGGLCISFDPNKQGPNSKAFKKLKEKKENDDELLANTVLTPEFEKQESAPPLKESVRQLKKKRREERAKTSGDGWYDMKAPELTDELKNDLKALKMRAAIDPKRFYKKNDRVGFPKYFQVGKVLDNPADFYHSRIPKKQRKQTMVEELLADADFRRYNKRKYQQIETERAAFAAGKKNRKKRKFTK